MKHRSSHNKKNKNGSDSESSDSESSKSQHLNLDVSPKFIPIAKLGDRLKTKKIIINVSDTQYPIVQQVASELGWIIQRKQGIGNWDVWWTDRQILPDVLFRMNLHQKINHYPGIYVLARKNLLGLGLMAMKEKFPLQYNFFPQTWVIPLQFSQFRHHYENTQKGKKRTYIVKPEAQSQGRGIFLTKNIEDIINGNKYVVQSYVNNPMLIDGLKFDLRIYVLLAGTDPLRLYIYEEGLTRLATQRYQQPNQQNLSKSYIHLTNYSLNKNNPNYIYNTSNKEMNVGHKRTLTSTYEHLKRLGHDIDKLKASIEEVIVKTTISGLPLISHQYRYCQPQQYEGNTCFHILGFDIMLTSDLKPILIQINHTPSFQTSTPLDHHVKKSLIKDTLRLMRINAKNKKILYEKSKALIKARIETGRRDILKGQQRINQIKIAQALRDQLQQDFLGGYKKIHPVSQQNISQTYSKLYQYAKKIEKQSHQTRKKIFKEFQNIDDKPKPEKKQQSQLNIVSYSKQSPSKKQKIDKSVQLFSQEIQDQQNDLLISNKVHSFRSKFNRKSSNVMPPLYHDHSLNKFKQIMHKYLQNKQAGDLFHRSGRDQLNQLSKLKQSAFIKHNKKLVKTNIFQNLCSKNRIGTFIAPKSYEINDEKEKYRPNITIKSIFKLSSTTPVKSSQSATKNFDKLRKAL